MLFIDGTCSRNNSVEFFSNLSCILLNHRRFCFSTASCDCSCTYKYVKLARVLHGRSTATFETWDRKRRVRYRSVQPQSPSCLPLFSSTGQAASRDSSINSRASGRDPLIPTSYGWTGTPRFESLVDETPPLSTSRWEVGQTTDRKSHF